ncbi:MAG: outer membrane lipoprotein carrier protein LolA [Calditrichia bacterium]
MVFFIIWLACITSSVNGANVGKIIKNIQKKYQETRTIRIHFKETARFQLTGTATEVDGILQMEGKEKFRLESEDQLLVNNGKTLWRFNKLDNQVLIDYAKKDEQDAMLNNLLFEINEHYFGQLVEELKEGKIKIYVLKLTPKPDEQSFFTAIKIWVRDKTWEINKLLYTDYNGNETEYLIENIEFNPDFTKSIFTFTPPQGTQVIDLRF